MNRQEFLEKLVILYEDFTKENTLARKEAYEAVLDDSISYDELYTRLMQEYNSSFKYAPPPALIYKLVKDIKSGMKEFYNAYDIRE